MKDGDIQMLEYVADYFLSGDVPLLNNEVESVLAEVPSYEEYLSLTYAKEEDERIIAEYEAENTKLKEQLKECELWFTGVVGNMNDKNCGEHNRNLPIGNFEHIFKVFSQKINQVLGEE
jgi:hypothetical protein